VKAGNTKYISGKVVVDPDGNVVGEGDSEVQPEYIWSNIERVLQESGSGLDEIVKIFVFAVGTKSINGAWDVRKRMILGKDPLTCVTSISVSGLFRPDLLLEIDVVAVTGN
jgi:enamine deaminase RidA (YjgF/YER057c/UK114 family)